MTNVEKITAAYFIPHCDNETCDLGSFNYQCPLCDTHCVDYDVWWKRDSVCNGEPHKFRCDYCKEELMVFFNQDEFEYSVKTVELK